MLKTNMHPIILIILDGWGYSECKKGNAIKIADISTIKNIWKNYPFTLLSASGQDVGLPTNQMGNSEVGHATIGSGRVINQDLVRISQNVKNQKFFTNKTLQTIFKKTQNKLHIIGLCSDGGVHSHIDHLLALISIAKTVNYNTCLHIITDGRDTEPKSAIVFIKKILNEIKDYKNINICTISGRYYSMDRDCRWSRTEKAYNALVENNIHHEVNPIELIKQYYTQNISDEFILPTRIHKGCIDNNDSIIFFNFRPDRTRQLVYALAQKDFKGFKTKLIKPLNIATFSQYDSKLNIPVVFPKEKHINFLGEIISKHGLKQLRLAETEKYAHVTYFLNGGREEPFSGEDRELICSPQVETYDLSPEMSAYKLTESLINAINKNIYSLIIANYANPDMVGHTGNLEATVKAIETVDKCIKQLLTYTQNQKYTLIITADHGNAEFMIDKNNKPCKSHTTNFVPLSLLDNSKSKNYNLRSNGSLADIAPTILELLNINPANGMNGSSLISKTLTNISQLSSGDI
uniref:2,3-bisphosphoglycerate-independent phosphoglycerate mutase n=1 Tax=Gastroclonium compressum TaxID=1852973 RepID=A0A173FZX3_GASCM|nr:phosphoglycerate mutase [Coeloseira compressa]ANH09567.1 phosphoglycerate mutase [Coeloseira compressa]